MGENMLVQVRHGGIRVKLGDGHRVDGDLGGSGQVNFFLVIFFFVVGFAVFCVPSVFKGSHLLSSHSKTLSFGRCLSE